MSQNGKPPEPGFDLAGEFYRWTVSDHGKDLMLIDRFTQMPLTEFFRVIEDGFESERAPILLAMIATSIRAKNPSWSVEKIARLVMDTSLSDVTFISTDEEDVASPPADGSAAETAAEPPNRSTSPREGSLSSPTPLATLSSETLSAALS